MYKCAFNDYVVFWRYRIIKLYDMQRGTFSVRSLATLVNNHLRNPTATSVLRDKHGRTHDYLRISLTERCNLRCRYCMPEEGIELSRKDQCLSLDELKKLSDLFVTYCGVQKVRLTGGEPTIDKKLIPLLEHLGKLRNQGLKTIGMTTNGLTLKSNATIYKELGLDSVNISLDTLKPERFELLTRRRGLERVLEGLNAAIEVKFKAVKLNCVVMKGVNDDEVMDFANLASNFPIEVRFIEFMPFAGNRWSSNKMIPASNLLAILRLALPNLEPYNSEPNEVSRRYKEPSMLGSIGFISSMSDNFCSGCNRLRLTSDGNLKVCLFERQEVSLRDLLRNGAHDFEIVKVIATSLGNKKKQHAGAFILQKDTSRPMIKIGMSRSLHSSSSRNSFSHIDSKGQAKMVDVSEKAEVKRMAIAQGRLTVDSRLFSKIQDQTMNKGDVLNVARVAGIMGAKFTSQLIPLCHQIPLNYINVDIKPCSDSKSLIVTARVVAIHNTGVEMESLTAVSITLLTLYDMCKSESKSMIIKDIALVSKVKQ